MKFLKKTILLILAMLPIKGVAYALDYAESVEQPSPNEGEMREEFLRKLDNGQLTEKYYRFLGGQSVLNSQQLTHESQFHIFSRVLRQYKKDRINSTLLAGSAASSVTE